MAENLNTSDCLQVQLPAAYELKKFEQLGSIRDKAKELASKEAEEGTIIWSHTQTNANALADKKWICNNGDLHCSIILRPEFERGNDYQMLIVAAVSLGNAIASYVSPMTALGYLWPNDIAIANHKIASVWMDNGTSLQGDWLALSLSVNVLHSPDIANLNAISIRQAEGTTDLTCQALLEAYSREFIKQINNWSERGYKYILDQWNIRLHNIGQVVELDYAGEKITGTVKAIDEYGNMEIFNDNNELLHVSIQTYMGLEP